MFRPKICFLLLQKKSTHEAGKKFSAHQNSFSTVPRNTLTRLKSCRHAKFSALQTENRAARTYFAMQEGRKNANSFSTKMAEISELRHVHAAGDGFTVKGGGCKQAFPIFYFW